MQDGVVDRRADDLAERPRPERRVVVDVAGLRPGAADQIVGASVDRQEVRADPCLLAQRRQRLGHEAPGRAHGLDLNGCAQLDHPVPLVVIILPGRTWHSARTIKAT